MSNLHSQVYRPKEKRKAEKDFIEKIQTVRRFRSVIAEDKNKQAQQ